MMFLVIIRSLPDDVGGGAGGDGAGGGAGVSTLVVDF